MKGVAVVVEATPVKLDDQALRAPEAVDLIAALGGRHEHVGLGLRQAALRDESKEAILQDAAGDPGATAQSVDGDAQAGDATPARVAGDQLLEADRVGEPAGLSLLQRPLERVQVGIGGKVEQGSETGR